MKIKDVLGQVGRFITGTLPSVMKLSEALTLLLSLITVKTAEKDVVALRAAGVLGQEMGQIFTQLGKEFNEFFAKLVESVDPASEGGEDLTGKEIKELAKEGSDIVPVVTQISAKSGALVSKIRALF
jgi:hypothetical protein